VSIGLQGVSSYYLNEWLTVNVSRLKTTRAFIAKILGKQQLIIAMKVPEQSPYFVLQFSIHVTLRN
jgi:hypothetical protein